MKLNPAKLLSLGTILVLSSSSIAQEPTANVVPAETRFSQQAFSQALLEQAALPNPQEACEGYGLEHACSFSRQYTFSDAELIHSQDGTRSITKELILNQPVNRDQALVYARILDTTAWIDHSTPTIDANEVVYQGCTHYYGEPLNFSNYGYLCSMVMTLTPDGITRIAFSAFSP